jgi:hypothetical protein
MASSQQGEGGGGSLEESSDGTARWSEAGMALRARSPALFRRALAMIEASAAELSRAHASIDESYI